MSLSWIVAASLAGGTLSAGAAALALSLRTSWLAALVSFAIGTLLGAAFLEVIPHAFEKGDAHEAAAAILAGIVGFFLLEKFLLWRHCHSERCEAHEILARGAPGRAGTMILIGDTVHNFVDGVLIAAAFAHSTELGLVTALAIIAHEVPQEVGDFVILVHSGYTRARALAWNLATSAATLAGGLLGYFLLPLLERGQVALLGVVAANMIYVAVADLIPGLHRRVELRDTVAQGLLIALGIGTIAAVGRLASHAH